MYGNKSIFYKKERKSTSLITCIFEKGALWLACDAKYFHCINMSVHITFAAQIG